MKSLKRGKSILKPEITNISEHGFWIFFKDKEYFLPFEQFPWFKNTTVQQISDVELWHNEHLYWPRAICVVWNCLWFMVVTKTSNCIYPAVLL